MDMAVRQSSEQLSLIPPPNGVVSNFDNPPSLHKWVLGVGITCMGLMTISVGIRTYTKAFIVKKMTHEDCKHMHHHIALFALVMTSAPANSFQDEWAVDVSYQIGFLVWDALYIYLSSIGITRDAWNIRAVDFPYMLYMTNVFQVIYPPSMGAAKYFIIIQLKNIFCPPRSSKGKVWWALVVLIFITIGYYVACFFTFLFQCIPREKIWHPNVEGRCIDNKGGVLSAGIINLLLDLGILTVPCWAIWHLQMSFKRRLGALAIFSVGVFTCAIAAAGLAYRVPALKDANATKASAKIGIWSIAELAGTIIVGCMPMFPRFYEHVTKNHKSFSIMSYLKSLVSSRGWSSSRGTGGQSSKGGSILPGGSSQRIVVTSEYGWADGRHDPSYIELHGTEDRRGI
ncbi:hypothetical protein PG991_010692 [Apiospora marii]|uniref:Rhodopsin domain-containing protein n=1 Tax=Apiospora marii TaxID=335849 RepID=A0ABR1RC07_9PEZI